jgi:hypothetical protein
MSVDFNLDLKRRRILELEKIGGETFLPFKRICPVSRFIVSLHQIRCALAVCKQACSVPGFHYLCTVYISSA